MRAIILLLALATLPQAEADSNIKAKLHQVINNYYYAIGEHRLAQAMSCYHVDSPQADLTKQELLDGQSAYLQRTNILTIDLIQHDDQHAVVRATHRHLRISGIKFFEAFTEAHYTFRQERNTWKIWSRSERRVNLRAKPDRYLPVDITQC